MPDVRHQHAPPPRWLRRVTYSLCASVLLVLLAACMSDDNASPTATETGSGTGSGQNTPGAAASPSIDPTLRDVTWHLESINGEPLPETAAVTLVLGSGGRSVCNSYTGTFVLGPDDAFRAESVAMTLMACAEDALNQLETRYVAALQAATTYEVSADHGELILRDEGGSELRFTSETT